VTTGSTIITMGVGVAGPTMEATVEPVIGIITAMVAGLEHRIGGTSVVMLPPEVFPSCFLCLVNVTGVNHFYSL